MGDNPEAQEKLYDLVKAIRTSFDATGNGGETIAFVSGNFNIIHPGHLRLLRFASETADRLVVGLQHDDTPGVTVPMDLRYEGLHAIAMVDEVVKLPCEAADFISVLKPDFVIKGREHLDDENDEQAIVDGYGGKLLFASGEVRFSSVQLLKREYAGRMHSAIELPKNYPERHDMDPVTLGKRLKEFRDLRMLVVGDVIMDEYIDCDPLGMSQEDPTIVVTPIDSHLFLGGAGIVAGHARKLGADVEFITVTGGDETSAKAKAKLDEFDVRAMFITDTTRPTTLKQRFRAHGKTLLRVSHLRQHAVDVKLAQRMVDAIISRLDDVDVLLFSDFNYGCLPQSVIDPVIAEARKRGVFVGADSQASSQMSDISRFQHMDLITPTEREARLALGDSESGLASLVQKLQDKADARNVIITLGAEGLLIYSKSHGDKGTDRLPAFTTDPRDVSGAGDCLFTITAMALRVGMSIWEAAYLGSLAAACQASRIGNTPLTWKDMQREIKHANYASDK
ncbi:PfkB family carbohydrate kinase [Ahrensia sp. R2A130]|uniref:PfkB family carbohydrate kinase n=1 Tax=Ahrensia sp. R2A130 TaxID=744979 RepID=UPI0001E08C3F|nr:PfkB family carbohydrate kinase [Ahrensia sp. R2A130]EFL89549.1 ADP-heptose synthase [Ahrensia sp. R2A130]